LKRRTSIALPVAATPTSITIDRGSTTAVVGFDSGELAFFDTATRRFRGTTKVFGGRIIDAAFSWDSRDVFVLSGKSVIAVVACDTQAVIGTIQLAAEYKNLFLQRRNELIVGNGRWTSSKECRGTVCWAWAEMYDPEQLSSMMRFRENDKPVSGGGRKLKHFDCGPSETCLASPDGAYLAGPYHYVTTIRRVSTGDVVYELPTRADRVRWSDDGKWLGIVIGGKLILVEVKQLPPGLAMKSSGLDDSLTNGDGVLDSGDRASLVVEVTNRGPGTAYDVRLSAVASSTTTGLLELGGAENRVGVLRKGEVARVAIRCVASAELQSGRLKFRVTATDPSGYNAAPIDIDVTTRQLELPKLSVRSAVRVEDAMEKPKYDVQYQQLSSQATGPWKSKDNVARKVEDAVKAAVTDWVADRADDVAVMKAMASGVTTNVSVTSAGVDVIFFGLSPPDLIDRVRDHVARGLSGKYKNKIATRYSVVFKVSASRAKTLEILTRGNGNGIAESGEHVRIVTTVVNDGPSTAYLWKIVGEWAGGKVSYSTTHGHEPIAPGTTSTATFFAVVPNEMGEGHHTLTLQGHDVRPAVPIFEAAVQLPTGVLRPRLIPAYVLWGRTGPDSTGAVEPGEFAYVSVWLTNVGGRSASNVSVALVGEAGGVDVFQRQLEVGSVPAGSTVIGTKALALAMKSDATASTAHLKLAVMQAGVAAETWTIFGADTNTSERVMMLALACTSSVTQVCSSIVKSPLGAELGTVLLAGCDAGDPSACSAVVHLSQSRDVTQEEKARFRGSCATMKFKSCAKQP
jgi:hypothetical protein